MSWLLSYINSVKKKSNRGPPPEKENDGPAPPIQGAASKKKKPQTASMTISNNNKNSCEDVIPKDSIGNLRKERFSKPSSAVPKGIDLFMLKKSLKSFVTSSTYVYTVQVSHPFLIKVEINMESFSKYHHYFHQLLVSPTFPFLVCSNNKR